MDVLTHKQRKKNMQNIKSKNTKPEMLFRKALWKRGIRYRINVKDIMGTPDVCIKSKKLAIFIDSEFWHGKMYLEGKIPKSNQEFWIAKFKRNIQRDKEVNEYFKKNDWKVFRFWSDEVKNQLDEVIDKVILYIKSLDT